MTIAENIPLQNLTTFRIGGTARFFVAVKTLDDIKEAVLFAQKNNLPIFILGGGSNVLISDKGFSGLVIKNEIEGIEAREVEASLTEVVVGAGVEWDHFVEYAVSHRLYGIENLSLIPGSVGGAPVQNIGAYGSEVKDTISWVETIDMTTGESKTFSQQECVFKYRDSYFKKPEGKNYIITRVAFRLSRQGMLNIQYKDIAEYIKNNNLTESDITLQKVRDMVIAIRTTKLPNIKELGTAGSFFKNPIIEKSAYEMLLTQYPTLPHYGVDDTHVKIPAAWMLDNLCGFKGYRDGNVGVYKNQALVLVNFGGASFDAVHSLAQKMIACVKEKTQIELEKEVQIIF